MFAPVHPCTGLGAPPTCWSAFGVDRQHRGQLWSFSLLKFLRRVPAENLKMYFDEREFDRTKEIDWDENQADLVQQVRTIIDSSE
jgi:hypothetical protein